MEILNSAPVDAVFYDLMVKYGQTGKAKDIAAGIVQVLLNITFMYSIMYETTLTCNAEFPTQRGIF